MAISRSSIPKEITTSPNKKKKQSYAKGGKVSKVMKEFKAGKLHSGSKKGPKVKSRKQAIAIALSEERKRKKKKSKKKRK
ncbi:MAG TPA: hypothetical protein DCS66_19190 [Flavobacteriaceae bacterium]|nr:hypothetical protein [Flavobacteriaceae bacterium]